MSVNKDTEVLEETTVPNGLTWLVGARIRACFQPQTKLALVDEGVLGPFRLEVGVASP